MSVVSPQVKRWAHRCGIASAVLWWLYAVFQTAFFSAITAIGLALYLVGLVACYAIGNYSVRTVAWLVASSRSR